MSRRVVVFQVLLVMATVAHGKIYERCELARELKDTWNVPSEQLSTWVCIARYESEFNTSAINAASGDHGIFQISELFWCSEKGSNACRLSTCDLLEDDALGDDVECARKIYEEHEALSGDGFNAWVVYGLYCKNNADDFTRGCFDKSTVKPDYVLDMHKRGFHLRRKH